MSNDTIIQLAIIVPLSIWLASLSIRAMKSEDPSQYDPLNTLARAIRFIKVFSRRFLLALSVFAVSLHFVVSSFSVTILAVITLNLSISWLIGMIYRDRTLGHIINLHKKVDSLNDELNDLKSGENKYTNPLLNPLITGKKT